MSIITRSATALPRVLAKWLSGLRRHGIGSSSALSRSIRDSGRLVLIPTVVSISHADGFEIHVPIEAGFSALREDVTGGHILMLWLDLKASWMSFQTQLDLGDGALDAIRCAVSIPVEQLAGTLPSTSSRPRTTGISEVPCDVCGELIHMGEPYITAVDPERDSLGVSHQTCVTVMERPSMDA